MQESITCPQCKMTSYHPEDIKQKYCGNCHQFHSEMKIDEVVVVAMPKGDMPNPPVPSVEKKCEDCGTEVWVAKKQIMRPDVVIDDNTKAICMNCYGRRMEGEEECAE